MLRSLPFFDDLPRLIKHHHCLYRPDDLKLHERIYTNYKDKNSHHQMLLCSGLRPDPANPHFNLSNIDHELLNNEFVAIMNNAQSFNRLKPRLKTTEKSKYHRAAQTLAIKNLSSIDTNINNAKLIPILKKVGTKPDFSNLLLDDFDNAKRLIESSGSILEILNVLKKLTVGYRSQIGDDLNFAKFTDIPSADTMVHQQYEQVIFTVLCFERIDKLCGIILRNIDKTKEKIPDLLMHLSKVMMQPNHARQSLVDCELNNIANVLLHHVKNEQVVNYGILKFLIDALPISTLTCIASNKSLPSETVLAIVNSAIEKIVHMHEDDFELVAKEIGVFLGTLEKNHPQSLNIKNVYDKAADVLTYLDKAVYKNKPVLQSIFSNELHRRLYETVSIDEHLHQDSDLTFLTDAPKI